MSDGSLIFDTGIDSSGFKSALTGLSGMAVKAGAAVGAALGAAFVGSVAVGGNYETSLAKVGTIADTTKVSLTALSDGIKSLSKETGASASELNETLYQAISAGADTAHAVDLVETAAKAAKAGFTDTTTAVDGLTSALNAFGMETTDAEGLANKFLITQNLGKTSFGELASSIGTVAPTANAAGVSVDELLASVTSLTANGIATSEAMTGLKAIMSNIIKPTSEASDLAKELGINFSASALKSMGFTAFLEDIKEKTGGDTEKMSQLFGSVEALNSVLTLTSEQGTELMNSALEEMATNTTALDTAYEQMTDTFDTALQKMLNSAKLLGVAAFDNIKEPLSFGLDELTAAIDSITVAFEEGGIEGLTNKVGEVLGDLITTITEAIPDIVDAGISVVDGLIKSLENNSEKIAEAGVDIVSTLIKSLTGMAPEVLQVVLSLSKGIVENIAEEAPTLIPQVVSDILDLITTSLSNIDGMIDAGLALIQGLADGLINSIPILVDRLPEILNAILEGIISAAGKLLLGGAEIMQNINQGMIDSLGSGEQFENIGAVIQKSIWNGIYKGFENFGGDLYEYIYKGSSMEEAANKLQTDAELMAAEARNELAQKELSDSQIAAREQSIADSEKQKAEQAAIEIANTTAKLKKSKEETQEAIKDNTEDLKSAWEQAEHDYKTGAISTDDELYHSKLQAWQAYGDESNKDHWQYYEDIKGMEQSFAADSIRQAEETAKKQQEEQEELTQQAEDALKERLQNLKDTQKQELSSVKSTLSDIVSTYKQQYNAVLSEQKSYTDGIRSQLDLFKKEETDDKITYSLENLADYKKAVSAYTSSIRKLKERGINDALLSEIQDAGMEDGTAYAKILLSKSDEELKELNDTYAEIDSMIEQSGKDMYGSQLDSINQNFVSEVSGLFGSLPAEIQGIGLESALAFAQGLSLSSGDAITQTEQFCDDLMTAISDGIDNGTVSAKGLTDNLIADFKAQTPDVLAAVSNMLNFDGLAAKVKAAVTAEISATSTAVAAGAGAKSYSKPEENQAQNSMKSFAAEFNRMLSDINKPLNIYLDRDKLGNANISFANLKSRQTGRLVFT